MNLEEEHQRFLNTDCSSCPELKRFYSEERWQQILESRRIWRIKQQALRDWTSEQHDPLPSIGKECYGVTPPVKENQNTVTKPVQRPIPKVEVKPTEKKILTKVVEL
jgi:hypothetical protein